MRSFLIIFFIFAKLGLNAHSTPADSVILKVKHLIENQDFKESWREIHRNRNLKETDSFVYDLLLSDIYGGSYILLREETLKSENTLVLESISKSFLGNGQTWIENKYGNMWKRMFWLSQIYYTTHDFRYRSLVEDCIRAYKKSLFKNDPNYIAILTTYINYAINNGEDWSYVLFYIPISEILQFPNHREIDIAKAYHQKGIAYLHKEICNRRYDNSNNNKSDKEIRFMLPELARDHIHIADSIYTGINTQESRLLREQVKSDMLLCKELTKHPYKYKFSEKETFAKPISLFKEASMDEYSIIAENLNLINNENVDAMEKSLRLLKEKRYKESAECIIDITPTVITPADMNWFYYVLIYNLSMYDGTTASQYLNQYYQRVKDEIIPYMYKNSTIFEQQRLWKVTATCLMQSCMKTSLIHPETQATVLSYDIFQMIKNLETETNNYIRYAIVNNQLDQFTINSLDIYDKKRDMLYFGNPNEKDFADNIKLIEFNRMLVNDKIPIDNVLHRIYSHKQISKNLNDKATLVEYITYINTEGHERYACFIVNTGVENPRILDLCSVEEAAQLISKDKDAVNVNYTSNKLYETFFSKIEPLLTHDTLIVCPVGILESVNFDAIYHDGYRLMDKYKIIRSYSGHAFMSSLRKRHSGGKTAELYGGIAYSKDQESESLYTARHFHIDRGQQSERGTLQYLQYTAEEVSSIRDILKEQGFEVNVHSGLTASEDVFQKQSGNAPSILHIATHGFFISNKEELGNHTFFNNLELYNDYKLLYSGLFLANSQNVWLGKSKLPEGKDGILTSYEISQMDLSNVQLAVLSACETADGFVDNFESIQGLQYAFRQAGTGNMLLTLWRVDDAITYQFMRVFYKELFSGKGIVDAYHIALNNIKKDYTDPYSWAAFIMVNN